MKEKQEDDRSCFLKRLRWLCREKFQDKTNHFRKKELWNLFLRFQILCFNFSTKKNLELQKKRFISAWKTCVSKSFLFLLCKVYCLDFHVFSSFSWIRKPNKVKVWWQITKNIWKLTFFQHRFWRFWWRPLFGGFHLPNRNVTWFLPKKMRKADGIYQRTNIWTVITTQPLTSSVDTSFYYFFLI